MRARAIIYAALALLLLILLFANWSLLATATPLNVVVGRVQAPIGLLVLLVAVLVFLIELAAHVMDYRTWQQERRQLTLEINQLRVRADQAEGARLVALQSYLERELMLIRTQLDRLLRDTRPPGDPVPPPPTEPFARQDPAALLPRPPTDAQR